MIGDIEEVGINLSTDVRRIDSKPYWDGLGQDQLWVQQCQNCELTNFPPRPLCPACLGPLVWMRSDGLGTLYSWSTVFRAPLPSFDSETPYTVGFVRLNEGCYLFSRIVDIADEDCFIGLPLSVRFRLIGGVKLAVFAPNTS